MNITISEYYILEEILDKYIGLNVRINEGTLIIGWITVNYDFEDTITNYINEIKSMRHKSFEEDVLILSRQDPNELKSIIGNHYINELEGKIRYYGLHELILELITEDIIPFINIDELLTPYFRSNVTPAKIMTIQELIQRKLDRLSFLTGAGWKDPIKRKLGKMVLTKGD